MYSTKKNHWLLPNQICIAKGDAVANNLMFETKKDHQIFLNLWDLYLGDMTEVLNYHLAPDNWIILFKTKNALEITKAYKKQRKKSKKAKSKNTLKCPKKMISEHIRIFLSQYVRRTNSRHGRKGTKVLERFRKYIVQDEKECLKVFNLLTKKVRKSAQIRKKYQASLQEYDPKNEIKSGSKWQVGWSKEELFWEGTRVMRCMKFIDPSLSILRNLFKSIPQLKKRPPHT